MKNVAKETKTLRLATVFSGIGAIEQALLRKHVKHEIVFACDNGDQTPYPCSAATTDECIAEFKRLESDIKKMRPTSDGLRNACEIIKQRRDRVAMLHEAVSYKFRVDWQSEAA